jgi:hypothetical protein
MNQPTFKESWQAYIDVCPGCVITIMLSILIIFGRAFYISSYIHAPSFIEITGLFSPWFSPWVACFIAGVFMSTHSEQITKRENQIVKLRINKIAASKFI